MFCYLIIIIKIYVLFSRKLFIFVILFIGEDKGFRIFYKILYFNVFGFKVYEKCEIFNVKYLM